MWYFLVHLSTPASMMLEGNQDVLSQASFKEPADLHS
jgi:hypothetical protein